MKFIVFFVATILSSTLGMAQTVSRESMERMFTEVFNPLRLQIVSSYPIISLRHKFVNAMNDRTVTLSLARKHSIIWGHSLGGNTPLAFSGPRPNVFEPAVIIVYENFQERMVRARSAKSPKEYNEYLEDLLLMVYLHEYYHIKKQEFWRLKNSSTEIVAFEKECWEYSVKEVLLPMQKGGRGKLLPGSFEETILSLYRSLKGNTTDKRWHDFFQTAYGR